MNRYDKPIILSRLDFVIDNMEYTFQTYDFIEKEEGKKVYSKYFDTEYKSSLRVVMEFVKDHWEIKSMHFQKNKKAT